VELSGNGYSNREEVVAKGVPIIWEEGECSVKSDRVKGPGISSNGGGDVGSTGCRLSVDGLCSKMLDESVPGHSVVQK
jgi:hypothetical protein